MDNLNLHFFENGKKSGLNFGLRNLCSQKLARAKKIKSKLLRSVTQATTLITWKLGFLFPLLALWIFPADADTFGRRYSEMSIHLYAEQGDKGNVAQCIAARANVNEADTTGQKPLHYAAAKGYIFTCYYFYMRAWCLFIYIIFKIWMLETQTSALHFIY
jgi:hypothetical protein